MKYPIINILITSGFTKLYNSIAKNECNWPYTIKGITYQHRKHVTVSASFMEKPEYLRQQYDCPKMRTSYVLVANCTTLKLLYQALFISIENFCIIWIYSILADNSWHSKIHYECACYIEAPLYDCILSSASRLCSEWAGYISMHTWRHSLMPITCAYM